MNAGIWSELKEAIAPYQELVLLPEYSTLSPFNQKIGLAATFPAAATLGFCT